MHTKRLDILLRWLIDIALIENTGRIGKDITFYAVNATHKSYSKLVGGQVAVEYSRLIREFDNSHQVMA